MSTRRTIAISDGGPLAFAPDETRLLVSSRIHRLDQASPPQAIANTKAFNRLRSIAGTSFVIAEQVQDGVAAGSVLFDWRDGSVSALPEGTNFTVSPDAQHVAGIQNGAIGLWKIKAENPALRSEPGSAGFMLDNSDDALHFSPDASLLAAALPNVVQVYDARKLTIRLRIPLARGERFAGFSRDGGAIATFRWHHGFPEPTFHPLTLNGILRETCARTSANLTPPEWSRLAPGTIQHETCPPPAG